MGTAADRCKPVSGSIPNWGDHDDHYAWRTDDVQYLRVQSLRFRYLSICSLRSVKHDSVRVVSHVDALMQVLESNGQK
jgi:hypothetical protein